MLKKTGADRLPPRVLQMLTGIRRAARSMWQWYRRRSIFMQILIFFPVVCGIALTVIVGNMGLAVMGTAFALNSVFVGWIGGAMMVIVGWAVRIVVRDRR